MTNRTETITYSVVGTDGLTLSVTRSRMMTDEEHDEFKVDFATTADFLDDWLLYRAKAFLGFYDHDE